MLRSLPQTRQLMERCVEEARSLALVRGVGLADNAVDATIGFIDGLAAGATTSLQRDIADGKPSELDYWNGAVVRLAKGNHVGVPTHELIYSLLSPLEQRSRGHLEFPSYERSSKYGRRQLARLRSRLSSWLRPFSAVKLTRKIWLPTCQFDPTRTLD